MNVGWIRPNSHNNVWSTFKLGGPIVAAFCEFKWHSNR